MYFSLWKDIFNHKDVYCFLSFNNGNIFFMINIYSDNPHSALKYLKDTEANLHNVLVMASDFNIRDSDWDLSYLFHSIHSNILFDIANLFSLKLSHSVQQVSMRYSDNDHDSNLVINLIFLYFMSIEINNNNIFPKLHYSSDHASLMVNISIIEEFIQDK